MRSQKMNIVTIICHDMGRYLGCYGVKGFRTPNLDEFGANNIRFENSFCTAPQCSPSRASLWTGRYPHANGVIGLSHAGFKNDLNDGERHLAEILNNKGYDTHLFGIQHVSPNPERCGFKSLHGEDEIESCSGIAQNVQEFLLNYEKTKNPLFLQAGLFEPHRPFPHDDVEIQDPQLVHIPPYLPDIPEVREDMTAFEASCSSADKAFGRIKEAVYANPILAENTIVIFTVDHGIAFPHAKMTLYDPGIETALLMRVPGTGGGKVFSEMISNVDIVPTLLDLLGLPSPDNLHGKSFYNLIRGEHYPPRDSVFAEKTYHSYYDPMRAIRTNNWKLIANFEFTPYQETTPDYLNNAKSYPEIAKALNIDYKDHYHPPFELFNLKDDPLEQKNLAEHQKYTEVRDSLICRLRQWMIDTEDPLLKGPVPQRCYVERMNTFMRIGSDP